MTEHPPLRLLLLVAHPDDAEFSAGGLACAYRARGHVVRIISVTDGGAGHHRLAPDELRRVRRAEAEASASVIGAECDTWEFPDGSLMPTLEVRERIIREIRRFHPDLVVTHRTCDYHPDHRAVGQAVQDASYMVTVPLVAPDEPFLTREPVVACMGDLFTRPQPLRCDVLLDLEPYLETMTRMLACHASQVFDFLPFNHGVAEDVPTDEAGRMEWLNETLRRRTRERAERFRPELLEQFGAERGAALKHIEAYEVSEYAADCHESLRRRLFLIDNLDS